MSQIGGYPTVYGGYESIDLNNDPGRFELVLKLNGYPLRAAGIEVAIHDVLNVLWDKEGQRFVAEMQR